MMTTTTCAMTFSFSTHTAEHRVVSLVYPTALCGYPDRFFEVEMQTLNDHCLSAQVAGTVDRQTSHGPKKK